MPRLQRRALPAQDDELGRHRARREQDGGVRRRADPGGGAVAAVRGCRQGLRVADEGFLPGAQRACADARGEPAGEPPVPDARDEAAASSSGQGTGRGQPGFLDRPRGELLGRCADRRLRTQQPAGRHALRPARVEQVRARPARALDRPGRAGRAPARTDGPRRATRRRVGGVLQRRLEQGAALQPLRLRAPVPRAPLLRRRSAAPGLHAGALGHAAGPAGEDRRSRRPVDDPGVRRVYYRLVAGARDDRRQDAHALRAERGADGALARALPRRATTASTRLPGYDDAHGRESVRDLRGAAGRRALPLHARGGGVHDHGLHQGPGLPRAARARRDPTTASGSPSSTPTDDYDDAMSAMLAREAQPAAPAQRQQRRAPADLVEAVRASWKTST